MIWPHYVYLHRRADTGEAFYVGKGKLRRGLACFERAFVARPSNKHWTRIVAKHGVLVEILAHCQTDGDAQAVERSVIAQFGRADRGAGPLINRTDGGDGHAGIAASATLREKRSWAASAPRSERWIASIRAARKGGGNGGVVKRGDKLPKAWVKNLSLAKLGQCNPSFGKPSNRRRQVIDRETGVIYPSITAVAIERGKHVQVIHNWLTGHRPNPTSLEFV